MHWSLNVQLPQQQNSQYSKKAFCDYDRFILQLQSKISRFKSVTYYNDPSINIYNYGL